MNLTPELFEIKEEIRQHALDYGLDFFDTIFELLEYDEINQVAAYGGFPTRYPHWRFGMEFEELEKGYAYGLQKIYELVINNDPCYAYLLSSNNLIDQKIVMAHVFAHCDFFKNNLWFEITNRKMMDELANHGTRIKKYMDRFGEDMVEDFIDVCLSIENLIDVHSPYVRRRGKRTRYQVEDGSDITIVKKIQSKGYMDAYINPPRILEQHMEDLERELQEPIRVPKNPEKDVLLFLLEFSHIPEWQRDILGIIREESYYFVPQRMTKIMNEGWASYWHSTIMTQKVLSDSEVVDFADHHSGTLATSPGQLNPYKMGIELLRYIEDKWNRGRFGKDFEECEDAVKKKNWDLKLGLGREKIFEVRKYYNDITFIDEFFDQEFCDQQKLYVYGYDRSTGAYVILDRDHRKVKQQLLFSLTNCGQPQIYVLDGNHNNRGELYLLHRFEGVEIEITKAQETLKNIRKIWGRPTHIETVVNDKAMLYSFDGNEHTATELEKHNQPVWEQSEEAIEEEA